MATDLAGRMPPARATYLAIMIACLKLWCFRPIKFLIGLGYVVVITEGLRMVVPALGLKLYNLPFLGLLRSFEVWHELDLAPFVAVLLFLFSSSIWCALLDTWLYGAAALQAAGRCPTRYQRCMVVLGSIILFSDACLFYRAMTMAGWGSEGLSLTSLFCTFAYLAILVSVCVVSVNLKRNYLSLKRGRVPYGAMP
jgi:hypothetical protein